MPWFRVESVSRYYEAVRGDSADLVIIVGKETIVAFKNRFNDDIERYRGSLIVAVTKFISQTIDNLAGWHDRCRTHDIDSIHEAVTNLVELAGSNTGITENQHASSKT